MISRNRIKYLRSLRTKKFRNEYRQFIAEGDKIVGDILRDHTHRIRQLIATSEWLSERHPKPDGRADEILEADARDMAQITTLETPPAALVVMDIPELSPDMQAISRSWSLALDTIQDPGNLGTIIRTADWFGITHILCNEGCADCYNPKVVQASMGALFHLRVHYTDLSGIMKDLLSDPSFGIYGTFTGGLPVYDVIGAQKGLLLFGNESRGISTELLPYITARITIPPGRQEDPRVDSLNVAAAVAVVCSVFTRV